MQIQYVRNTVEIGLETITVVIDANIFVTLTAPDGGYPGNGMNIDNIICNIDLGHLITGVDHCGTLMCTVDIEFIVSGTKLYLHGLKGQVCYTVVQIIQNSLGVVIGRTHTQTGKPG